MFFGACRKNSEWNKAGEPLCYLQKKDEPFRCKWDSTLISWLRDQKKISRPFIKNEFRVNIMTFFIVFPIITVLDNSVFSLHTLMVHNNKTGPPFTCVCRSVRNAFKCQLFRAIKGNYDSKLKNYCYSQYIIIGNQKTTEKLQWANFQQKLYIRTSRTEQPD